METPTTSAKEWRARSRPHYRKSLGPLSVCPLASLLLLTSGPTPVQSPEGAKGVEPDQPEWRTREAGYRQNSRGPT